MSDSDRDEIVGELQRLQNQLDALQGGLSALGSEAPGGEDGRQEVLAQASRGRAAWF